ncbi:hypothetical protein G7Z17_g10869 [Cylindrodendrum hubeiense]|uniref:Amino acid permease/ SLC12A domain-containing protein n=1 Tax=Cylindrodendrum hubeiense TaxID=595255 RepID=A0A9P5H1W3_9HYPO|nr:hypothetical protein G7Z17_g10869 [Cylindrodendrum hubeiense]
MADDEQQPDRYPDWFPDWARPGARRNLNTPLLDVEEEMIPLQTLEIDGESQQTRSNLTVPEDNSDGDGFTRTTKVVFVTPRPERTVSRKLRGIQLFMITVNTTLGTGLYWRGGQILELGGPLAVVLSFLLVGILACAVMQCIAELLCIWPVPGALSVYVSEFVDVELGIAVGITYWFTYSVSFAALMATVASELGFWADSEKVIHNVVIYLIPPIIPIAINMFRVETFGWIEVATGATKLLFLLIILLSLVTINLKDNLHDKHWKAATQFDEKATRHWVFALFMSTSIATFAYVGVEVVAASALEARWSNSQRPAPAGEEVPFIRRTVKFSAVFFSLLAVGAYTLSGLLTSLDIPWDDCRLPRLSWVEAPHCDNAINSTSAFVIIADESKIQNLDDVFNAFLVFTAVTCGSATLFVASRSLFGLTARLDGGSTQPWYIRILALFGKTNRHKVPVRAVILSAGAFFWLPPLQLLGDATKKNKPNDMVKFPC